MKNKLVVADLGAGGNLVKNLILLSSAVHWPSDEDRYQTILNQYKPHTALSDWLPIEYRLRFWNSYYGVDLSDNLDLEQYIKADVDKDLPVVFLNHSAFYQLPEFEQFNNLLDVICVAPTTDFGIEWQVRSYCEKKTVPQLHDFSFETDREEQINKYISTHSAESYYRMNIKNFKEIVSDRQQLITQRLTQQQLVPLEQLVTGPAEKLVETVQNTLNIELPLAHCCEVISAWRNLHWSPEKTSEWEYHDCIA